MIAAPRRDLADLALFDELPSRGDEVRAAADVLLNLQQLLERVHPLHRVVTVTGRQCDQLQSS